MRVEERMTKDICCCRTEDSLATAARQLWDRDCGCLPVVDDRGHVLGMITDRDICMAAMTTGKALTELLVAYAMARNVAVTRPSDSLHEAEMIMRARSVRRLPVLDEQNRVIGILSCNDLFRWVDDDRANGAAVHDAFHLARTLAAVGRSQGPRTLRALARSNGAATAAASIPRATPVPSREGALARVAKSPPRR